MGTGLRVFDVIMDKSRDAASEEERRTHRYCHLPSETLLLDHEIPPCLTGLVSSTEATDKRKRHQVNGRWWNTA
jgi:hypothetical protein